MTLDPTAVGTTSEPRHVSWTSRDSCLYALGVGSGADELAFTTENTSGVLHRALPTMPAVLGTDVTVLKAAGRIDWTKLFHAAQSVVNAAELPPAGSVSTTTRLAEMWDKGKAAVVVLETEGRDVEDDALLFTTRMSLFIRGAGGWGGDRGPSQTVTTPDAPPDQVISYQTRPDQALIYRLSGDRNPLHSDPSFAMRAGFDRPILHGLCTFGFAARAVLHAVAAGDPSRVTAISTQFAAPVFPADSLDVDLWDTGGGQVSFQVRRNGGPEIALSGGQAQIEG